MVFIFLLRICRWSFCTIRIYADRGRPFLQIANLQFYVFGRFHRKHPGDREIGQTSVPLIMLRGWLAFSILRRYFLGLLYVHVGAPHSLSIVYISFIWGAGRKELDNAEFMNSTLGFINCVPCNGSYSVHCVPFNGTHNFR